MKVVDCLPTHIFAVRGVHCLVASNGLKGGCDEVDASVGGSMEMRLMARNEKEEQDKNKEEEKDVEYNAKLRTTPPLIGATQ